MLNFAGIRALTKDPLVQEIIDTTGEALPTSDVREEGQEDHSVFGRMMRSDEAEFEQLIEALR